MNDEKYIIPLFEQIEIIDGIELLFIVGAYVIQTFDLVLKNYWLDWGNNIMQKMHPTYRTSNWNEEFKQTEITPRIINNVLYELGKGKLSINDIDDLIINNPHIISIIQSDFDYIKFYNQLRTIFSSKGIYQLPFIRHK